MVRAAPDTWFTGFIKKTVILFLVFTTAVFLVRGCDKTFGEEENPAPRSSQRP